MLGGWVGAGPRAPLSQLRGRTRAPSPRAARATPTMCPTHDPRGPLGGGGQRHSHCWTQRDRPAPTPPGRLPAGPAPQICAGGVPGCGPWRAAARAWMRRCWASFPPAMNRTPAFTRLFWRGFPKLDSEFCSRPRGAGRGRGEGEHVGAAASEPGLHSLPACAVTGTGRTAARSAHSVTAITPSLARLGTSDPPGRRLDGPTQGRSWVYTRVLRAQRSGDFQGCPCWGGVLLESRGWGPGCRSAPHSAQDRGTWPQSPCCLGRNLLWTEPATLSLGRVWLVGVTGAPRPMTHSVQHTSPETTVLSSAPDAWACRPRLCPPVFLHPSSSPGEAALSPGTRGVRMSHRGRGAGSQLLTAPQSPADPLGPTLLLSESCRGDGSLSCCHHWNHGEGSVQQVGTQRGV